MYYVYILASQTNSVLYIGVTNNLRRRLDEHKNGAIIGFTKRYHVDKLVYYEVYSEITDAFEREKRLKRLGHEKKNWLVESKNPSWSDLGIGIL